MRLNTRKTRLARLSTRDAKNEKRFCFLEHRHDVRIVHVRKLASGYIMWARTLQEMSAHLN